MTKKASTPPYSRLRHKSITVCFLGPDGSGKSTIIQKLLDHNLPFKRYDYFHLKPFFKHKAKNYTIVEDPHSKRPYGLIKSLLKLFLFVIQYNIGWVFNILCLKLQSSMIIFDRYFDDILVDNLRYRYGGNIRIAKIFRYLIPKPRLYFILTTNANVIYNRKKEVSLTELERQIVEYQKLADGKRYINIEVNRSPEEIVNEINSIILNRLNE